MFGEAGAQVGVGRQPSGHLDDVTAECLGHSGVRGAGEVGEQLALGSKRPGAIRADNPVPGDVEVSTLR